MTDSAQRKTITTQEYNRRICVAMNYISRNLTREIGLDEIAEVACFSKFHFHRIFKVIVGETVAEFTRRLRLELAANRLLANPPEEITAIAHACGFSSSQNFAKAFRQHFSTTPTEYRKRKQGNTDRKNGNAATLRLEYDVAGAFENAGMEQTQSERRLLMDGKIMEMPAYHVAYVRKMGAYGKETCEAAFGELMQWAGPGGYLQNGTVLGLYWDNPEVTPPEKCRTDACVTVPEGTKTEAPIALQTIDGGQYAVCHFELTNCEDFGKAWEEAFGWFVENGYECADKPCYELYHSCGCETPGATWIFDICIPLK